MRRFLFGLVSLVLVACASPPSRNAVGEGESGKPSKEASSSGAARSAQAETSLPAKTETPRFSEPFEPLFAADGLVFAVPRPVLRWKPLPPGWSLRIQAAAEKSFAEGTLLFDEETREAKFALPKPLPLETPVFLRVKRRSSLGIWEEWTPAASVAYKPLEPGLTAILEPGRKGVFTMGNNRGMVRERPEHKITLTIPFALGKTEVTNSFFAEGANRFLESGEWEIAEDNLKEKNGAVILGLKDLTYGRQFGLEVMEGRLVPRERRGNHPLVGLSWHGALIFCDGLSSLFGLEPVYGKDRIPKAGADGFRLPTEAEWEFAARGERGLLHPQGRGLDPRSANYFKNWDPYEPLTGEPEERGGPTTPAGYFDGRIKEGFRTSDGSSAFGLFDMLGNVWEWCWDRFDAAYYLNSRDTDPSGPEAGDSRVVRGCAWNTPAADVSFSNRGFYAPDGKSWSIGLRLARTLK